MKEIKRIEDIPHGSYTTNCIKCNKEIELYWNGGELDMESCCGFDYYLEHSKVDFVIYEGIELNDFSWD